MSLTYPLKVNIRSGSLNFKSPILISDSLRNFGMGSDFAFGFFSPSLWVSKSGMLTVLFSFGSILVTVSGTLKLSFNLCHHCDWWWPGCLFQKFKQEKSRMLSWLPLVKARWVQLKCTVSSCSLHRPEPVFHVNMSTKKGVFVAIIAVIVIAILEKKIVRKFVKSDILTGSSFLRGGS